jgi:hypothetical protein
MRLFPWFIIQLIRDNICVLPGGIFLQEHAAAILSLGHTIYRA